MKAIVIDQYGNVEELKEREVLKPIVKGNEVLIRILATSVNPVDWKIRKGDLQEQLRFSFPIILGLDVAGVIEEVGEEVECFKIGDKVYTKPENIGKGSYAEFITVKSDLVSYMPTNLSFEEAASIPLAGLTAWQSLVDYAKIKEHDRVLIHAGAGGVGSLAIQIAKSFGAFVATTASNKNEGFLWLKPNGKQLEALSKLIVHGKIKPIISKVVPFNEEGVREAHILSEGQHVRGKIVMKVGG